MVQLTKKQHVFIVLRYIYPGNTTAVQRRFQARFPDRNLAYKTTILRDLAMKIGIEFKT